MSKHLNIVENVGEYVTYTRRQKGLSPSSYKFVRFRLHPPSLLACVCNWWMTSSFNCEFNRNCFDENYEKLRRWQINTWRGIMRVRIGKNVGILEEFALFDFLVSSQLLFFANQLLYYDEFFRSERSHWEVRIVFLNFQNLRIDNFNLAKALGKYLFFY